MIKTKFVFTVSILAILTVNSALASAPRADNSDIGTAHSVFTNLTPTDDDGAGAGIAGVTYVNRAVNKAGTAAIAAEAHAAAAGAYAVSAKSSADTAVEAAGDAQTAADAANAALAGKQDKLTAGSNITIANGTISATVPQITVDTSLSASSTNPVQNKVVNSALAGKQATLTTSNIKGAGSVSVGISNGVITVTGTDNNTTYSTGTASTSGLTKLYTDTGTNTDGTMTQAALKTALDGKLSTTGTAARATADANGKTIAATYATKTELTNKVVNEVPNDGQDSVAPSVELTNTLISDANTTMNVALNQKADKSEIPTVNNARLTIQRNGTTVGTFTANQSSATTINITDNDTIYTLPKATADTLGGVKVGTNLTVADGVLSVATGTPSLAGVTKVGQIPSGSQTSTTYANIWVQ